MLGARTLTLNNNHQDGTNARQCVAYELFAEAGLPAPRCGLAHVTVNGVDKGFYSSVEPVDEAFLRRAFGNDLGNLYELAISDFTPELNGTFELKTDERPGGRSDLDRVERALAVPDEQLVESLGEVFDVDELVTYWAMEVLTSHWDGMTGNRNNSFVYHDPTDDRFHPIPWGTDGSFEPHRLAQNVAASVFALNSFSERLYRYPPTRRMYHARLRELLGTVWNEDRIVARLREIAGTSNGNPAVLGGTEAFVRGRRAAIEAELAMHDGRGPDEVGEQPFDTAGCREPLRASGVIDYTWNDVPQAFQPVADVSALALELPVEGARFAQGTTMQLASISPEGQAQLALLGLDPGASGPLIFALIMPPMQYRVGEIPFHGIETFGAVLRVVNNMPQILALVGDGRIVLSEAGRTNGAAVRGRWEGRLASLPGGARAVP